jgi:hypothetical protein
MRPQSPSNAALAFHFLLIRPLALLKCRHLKQLDTLIQHLQRSRVVLDGIVFQIAKQCSNATHERLLFNRSQWVREILVKLLIDPCDGAFISSSVRGDRFLKFISNAASVKNHRIQIGKIQRHFYGVDIA